MTSGDSRIVGLLPAAGRAKRISPLPMSKELYPIGFSAANRDVSRPKVVSQYLLERMSSAGVCEAFFILRPGKWDIPSYFGDGSGVGVRLAYLTVHVPFGVPFTLDQAYPFIRGATIALGFPDILFWPESAYSVLLRRLAHSTAAVVLGLFPTDQPSQVGVVDLDDQGLVRGLHEKSDLTHLPFMWAIAVWKPEFTEFLHEFIQAELSDIRREEDENEALYLPPHREMPIGDVINAAILSGMRVEAETFPSGSYFDIGTPSNLLEAIRHELATPERGTAKDR
jgi:glucose-1-phosphate thymidylyltransferase